MILNDYLGLIGFSGLSLGLGFAVFGLLAGGYYLLKKDFTIGWISRIIILIQFICLAVSVFSLGGLLLNNAFEYPLVFDAVENSMPWFQKLSGLWSGQSSSLLFWSFILSLVILLISGLTKKRIDERFSALVSLILGIALVFFLVPILVLSNPFEKIWQLANGSTLTSVFAPPGAGLIVPLDGVGMNPSLRHIAMLLHPPFLYLGLVGFFIPYAVSLAALIRGGREDNWIKLLMPVTLIAWVFLTLGMFLGSWWAYTILGWGGYWGWDAVEIAGLLPWLLSFGLLHSLRKQLSGNDYLRWIVVFSGLIFISILSGILITRSGILESVHAYSAGVMGPVLTIFIVINLFIYGFFMVRSWKDLKADSAKGLFSISDLTIQVFNYVILALVVLFFIGQTYPLTSRLFTGTPISWDAEQYENYSSPLLILLLLASAICPLLDLYQKGRKRFWRKVINSSAVALTAMAIFLIYEDVGLLEVLGFYAAFFLIVVWSDSFLSQFLGLPSKNKNDLEIKNRFSGLGSTLIHIGLGLMALGIMGQETLSDSYDLRISQGDNVSLGNYMISIQDSRQVISPEDGSTISSIDFLVAEKGAKDLLLVPDLEYYPKMQMLYARPAIDTDLKRDIQVILKSWKDETDSQFEVHISINPLMIWIWIGGALMSLGGILSLVIRRTKFIKK